MWWQGRLIAFDVETTGTDPEQARIVTAAVAACGGDAPTVTRTWLADPGVEIPTEATEVHGITTEKAREEGRPAREVIAEVIDALAERPDGTPVVAFNARYDLTVLDREARRHGLVPLADRGPLLVVDPLVTDKWLDRYRSGSRKLEAICQHYGARLDDAHAADSDALAAARAAWVLGAKGRVIRQAWNEEMEHERAALITEWAGVRSDLEVLHRAQVQWAHEQAVGLADYFREQGKHDDAEQVRGEWPIVPFVP